MYSLRAKVKFQIFTTLEHGNQLQTNAHMITIEGWLNRRRFLSTLLAGTATACAAPSLLDCFRREMTLFAEAAELSREAITVDLHCHPNLGGSRKLAEFDSDVPDNMRAGGLDAGVFAVRGDHGTIRRNSSGRYAEYRKADPGELFQGSQDQLDKVLKAAKAGSIGLAQSPVGYSRSEEKRTAVRHPCH